MSGKILTIKDIETFSTQLHSQKKKVVVAGGCFDILHAGHILFLAKAKEQGDILIVLLENDMQIRKLKGEQRPINTQEDRAFVLAAITYVDYVVKLPEMKTDALYDQVISAIKPAIIATTSGDPARSHKERQARLYGCIVVDVIDRIESLSTTKTATLMPKKYE